MVLSQESCLERIFDCGVDLTFRFLSIPIYFFPIDYTPNPINYSPATQA